MKIQIGEIVMNEERKRIIYPNKTYKYLAPCLEKYGPDFQLKIKLVWTVAVGLGDMMIVAAKENTFEQHLFILLDSTVATKNFINFLEWIKDEDYYIDDYVYDNIQKSTYHMVVIKMPEQCTQTFEEFTKGNYSKMYSPEEINSLFESNPDVKKILIKDHNYIVSFVRSLNKKYDTTLKPEDWTDKELDFPPDKNEYFQ